jgi:hypothetical protein
MVKIEKYLTEFKKDLRYALRSNAFNMFGKKVKELNSRELKTALSDIYKRYEPYYVQSTGIKLYKDVFKETFKNELKRIKK